MKTEKEIREEIRLAHHATFTSIGKLLIEEKIRTLRWVLDD